jgi:hypothetical protein
MRTLVQLRVSSCNFCRSIRDMMRTQSRQRLARLPFTPATRHDRLAKAAAVGVGVADWLADNPSDGALHALRINGFGPMAGAMKIRKEPLDPGCIRHRRASFAMRFVSPAIET